jgi:hypothetical protein
MPSEDVFQFTIESRDLNRFRKPTIGNRASVMNMAQITSYAERLGDAPCSKSAIDAICSRRWPDSGATEDCEVLRTKRQLLTNSKAGRGDIILQRKGFFIFYFLF